MSAILTVHADRAVAALSDRQREIVDEHVRDLDGNVTLSDLVDLFDDRAEETRESERALSLEMEAIASDLAFPRTEAYR